MDYINRYVECNSDKFSKFKERNIQYIYALYEYNNNIPLYPFLYQGHYEDVYASSRADKSNGLWS